MDNTNGETFNGQMIERKPGRKNTTAIVALFVNFGFGYYSLARALTYNALLEDDMHASRLRCPVNQPCRKRHDNHRTRPLDESSEHLQRPDNGVYQFHHGADDDAVDGRCTCRRLASSAG